MADGNINVAVQAEGVDDATGELGGGAAPGGAEGGGIGGGGDGGGGRGGTLKKLLVRLAALVAFAGPILDAIKPITKIMSAFVAPLAVTLLRLLQPVLRLMVKLLPTWFAFMETVNGVIENLSVLGKISTLIGIIAGGLGGAKIGAIVGSLIGGFLGSVVPGLGTAFGAAIGAKVGAFVGGIVGGITGGVTLGAIATRLDELPSNLATIIPGVSSTEQQASAERASQVSDPSDGAGGGPNTVVRIEGTPGQFVENVNRDKSYDL